MKGSRGAAMSIVGARKKTKKDLATNVQCPQCNAWPGDRCQGVGRHNVHEARFKAWKRRNGHRSNMRDAKRRERAPVEQPSFLKGVM
jgi:hypothetical protein